MRVVRLRVCTFFIATIGIFAAQGCSTIIGGSDAVGARQQVVEQEALRLVAKDVARTPWRKPDEMSLSDRLTGFISSKNRFSRSDAVNGYLSSLKAMEDPKAAVLSDAKKNLAAANSMIAIAYRACESTNPQLVDVAVIEDAIASLRETRTIYAASLKKLNGENDAIDQLEESFDAAVKELGRAADKLAENAIRDRTNDIAGRETRSNLVGAT